FFTSLLRLGFDRKIDQGTIRITRRPYYYYLAFIMANCLQEVRVEKREDYHVAPLRAKTSLLGFSLLRRSRNELHRANFKKYAFKKKSHFPMVGIIKKLT
ncbi:MAG: hypothetical protein Q8O18_05040, partial [Deltaproteobacteria bacterium]|nr:hypothetical protein [Deltaproteobacteria bacterium]